MLFIYFSILTFTSTLSMSMTVSVWRCYINSDIFISSWITVIFWYWEENKTVSSVYFTCPHRGLCWAHTHCTSPCLSQRSATYITLPPVDNIFIESQIYTVPIYIYISMWQYWGSVSTCSYKFARHGIRKEVVFLEKLGLFFTKKWQYKTCNCDWLTQTFRQRQ